MNDNFKKLSSELFNLLDGDQVLTLSLSGENSHFCRLSQSKVRQIGDVLDTNISLSIIYLKNIGPPAFLF